MSNDFTGLASLRLPESATAYITEQSTIKSRLLSSPAVVRLEAAGVVVTPSARTVHVPFIKFPEDESQLYAEGVNIESNDVESAEQVSPVIGRAQSFGETDLAVDFSGVDPVQQVMDGIAGYWASELDRIAVQIVRGFTRTTAVAGSMAGNLLDISAEAGAAGVFDADSAIDATALLGDDQDAIGLVLMHSRTYAKAKKDDLIAFVQPSDGGAPIPTYQGKALLVTDQATRTGAGFGGDPFIYDTHFLGVGSIGYAEGTPKVALETYRQPKVGGGREEMISRRLFVCHPIGAKWTPGEGVPAATTPSNAELANAANWTRVYRQKNTRIVTLRHRL